MTRARQRLRRTDRGQATVELALLLPFVALLLLAFVQAIVVARDQLLVTHAAREAARAAAVDADPGAARRAAVAAGPLAGERLEVDVGERGAPGGRVRVEVRYAEPTHLPLVGRMVGDLTLRSDATMRVER
ncbi:MAG TPA: TadE family type IV pilus minor pilin [Acidimicrobiales bacterium]|nr:TadE family type IV pilus minor pilin [Acidimicrobiales bacterium]